MGEAVKGRFGSSPFFPNSHHRGFFVSTVPIKEIEQLIYLYLDQGVECLL